MREFAYENVLEQRWQMTYYYPVNDFVKSIAGADRRRVFAFCALVFVALAPSDGFGVSWCLFHALFGMDCPACGLTRSMSCALHGNLASSVSYHPLGILALLALGIAALAPARLHQVLSFVRAKRNMNRWIVASFVALITLIWLWRISN